MYSSMGSCLDSDSEVKKPLAFIFSLQKMSLSFSFAFPVKSLPKYLMQLSDPLGMYPSPKVSRHSCKDRFRLKITSTSARLLYLLTLLQSKCFDHGLHKSLGTYLEQHSIWFQPTDVWCLSHTDSTHIHMSLRRRSFYLTRSSALVGKLDIHGSKSDTSNRMQNKVATNLRGSFMSNNDFSSVLFAIHLKYHSVFIFIQYYSFTKTFFILIWY